MGRIRILSDNVANKIAAGEVVERPASVVKELLENALDAGATSLRIEIESGGRRLIRITDDGCGMLRDDALLAFERHATSKLSDVRDLESIATLGFRGEALPSIASVSRLQLETRSRDEQTGSRVEIAGGKLLRCDEAALAAGTVITVRDLFFNVPARKKFLRTDQTELAHVASLVTHYSLAHPDKTFDLSHDGSSLLNVTPVEALRERVFQVFGSRTLEELVDLGAREKELILAPKYVPAGARPSEHVDAMESEEDRTRVFLLRGFVSRPQIQKTNRNSIFLFVNGRLIRDKLLLHALSSAYHNLMPPACYPFALLFIDCDAEEVDVNVHPSKTEIRFRHSGFVHDFVRDTVREVLMESRPVSELPVMREGQRGAALPYSEFSQRLENFGYEMAMGGSVGQPTDPARGFAPAEDRNSRLPELTLKPTPAPAQRFDFGGAIEVDASPAPALRVPDTHGSFPADALPESASSLTALSDLRPLGQRHESFIIAAGRDGLWIIDQHVAHERILFERVLKQRSQGRVEMQQLLMPMVIELTAVQQIQYGRIADELNATGFETEPFGNRTVAVKAAPSGVAAPDIEKVLFDILEIAESELRKTSLDDVRRGIAASIACRAAIKINMKLESSKMEWLLASLAACEYPMACPHGRPIALRYSMREILKSFHRM
jgi:DNA mismatch repair protein MutL